MEGAEGSIIQVIEKYNGIIGGFVWGPWILSLIMGVGLYFTVKLNFFQFTKFGTWNKHTLGLLIKAGKPEAGAVTPFQAFCTAMAATAGVGNLVGVSGSIIAGGPGAIFWMFVSGVLGMITKYAEILLAIRYRERNAQGEWVGGPMFYISKGLGPNFKWLAVIFSICGAVCAFGIGNMTQINAVVGTTQEMMIDLKWITAEEATAGYSHFKLVLGIVLAVLVGLVIVGGFKRIGETVELLVPFAGIFCIIGSIIAIYLKADKIGEATSMIFQGAFNFKAAAGGVLGYTFMQALRFGVARGVFTNEAGMGSAPIAHAAADVDHPVKQGMWGCFEVFADTLIMCTLTAYVILTSGLFIGPETGMNGSQLVSGAFKASFGVWGSVFLAISVLVFAYCTTLSWSLYGLRCFQFLTGGAGSKGYMVLYSLTVVIAAVMQITLAWDIADTLNGLMMIPNLVGVIALSGVVISLTKEFFGEK